MEKNRKTRYNSSSKEGGMWKSKQDALQDISKFSDFGGTSCDVMSRCLKKDPESSRLESEEFLDPRTGEVIDVKRELDHVTASRGRGALIEDYKVSLKLRKQLRMNRPMGFGNNVIETYFSNSRGPHLARTKNSDPPKESTTTAEWVSENQANGLQLVSMSGERPSSRNVLLSNLLKIKAKEECKNMTSIVDEGVEEGNSCSFKV